MPYIIQESDYFKKKSRKLISKNKKLILIVADTIEDLSINPRLPSLKSHKVNSPKFGDCFSSTVTSDIRIIWRYNSDGEIEILELLDIGGNDEVY
jgi:mRNA-degrading endonuclease YafQ of YafQ-DinJ toxin-antitoxin module